MDDLKVDISQQNPPVMDVSVQCRPHMSVLSVLLSFPHHHFQTRKNKKWRGNSKIRDGASLNIDKFETISEKERGTINSTLQKLNPKIYFFRGPTEYTLKITQKMELSDSRQKT